MNIKFRRLRRLDVIKKRGQTHVMLDCRHAKDERQSHCLLDTKKLPKSDFANLYTISIATVCRR